MSQAETVIGKIRNRYLLLRFTETTFMAVAFSLFVFTILFLASNIQSGKVIIAFAGGIILFAVRIIQLGLFDFKNSLIASYLSRQYKDLEESADLLIAEDDRLTLIQQIQKQKAAVKLEALRSDIRVPHRLNLALASLLLGFTVWYEVVSNNFSMVHPVEESNVVKNTESIQAPADPSIAVSGVSIRIVPPAYTSIRSSQKNDFNLVIPESSVVRWSIQFTHQPLWSCIILSTGDTLKLVDKGSAWETERKLTDRGFYSVYWEGKNGNHKSSNYYKIEVIKDQPPKIRIDNLAQFTEYSLEEVQNLKFNASISDDYGISETYIIATVSKGSGESIKFREEKLRFDSPQSISGKQFPASRSIDFHQLGMEPGDELYFYIEAFDNKTPEVNHARTETWFIALRDTAQEVSGFDSGMGVDLMPEYFRSQRQIIIDTEKLLAEKAKNQVTQSNFNYRSNELGYDQKVLRLRYGQFLGEEFESTVVPTAGDEEAEEEETDVTKKFSHTHDKENEHNLVKEKKEVKPEEHAHDEGDPNSDKENPIDAFTHKHDSGDESTFFVQSVKTKLKAALTLMWDAELQLRLYEPAKSLPVQYKILKLLKEIANDSRVYVHRNGFDPPPLKEEKRLTGDLEELKNTSYVSSSEQAKEYPAIREALQILGVVVVQDSLQIDQNQRTLLLRAGNELAGIAMEQPGEYLETLSLIKSVSENEIKKRQLKPALQKIIASFWNVLPSGVPSPTRRNRSLHPLDKSFVQQLELQKNE